MDKRSFPKNIVEALAYLYCEKHAPADISEEDLISMYVIAFRKIEHAIKESNDILELDVD